MSSCGGEFGDCLCEEWIDSIAIIGQLEAYKSHTRLAKLPLLFVKLYPLVPAALQTLLCMINIAFLIPSYIYRIRGLFGGDFNLVVRRITSESPNLNCIILKAIF